MYAAIAYLAGSNEAVVFPLGATISFSLSRQPIPFECPVSYLEPGEVLKDEDLADYDFEDDDADLDELAAVTTPSDEEPVTE